MEGLRVVGDGTASVSGSGCRSASAKLIFLTFSLTEVSYPYSITGNLNGASCPLRGCAQRPNLPAKLGRYLKRLGLLFPKAEHFHLAITPSRSMWLLRRQCRFIFALDGPMSTPTPTPTPIPVTHPTNLSTRLFVDTGNFVVISGFIITGSGPRHLLLRGIGPSLGDFGIPNWLFDATLELHGPTGFTTIANNNWRDTQEGEIIGTGRAPSNDLESAIVADLAPGTYTAILRGTADTTGVGLVEIYDLTPDQDSRLANISTRGNVRTGDDIMIAGFILGGASGEDSIIVRGLGPSLSALGVPNALADPSLELRDSNGALLIGNNNWQDDPAQAAIISAAGLAPTDSMESAVAATLMPGPYTALLSGVNNGTGIGLVEVYDRGCACELAGHGRFFGQISNTACRAVALAKDCE